MKNHPRKKDEKIARSKGNNQPNYRLNQAIELIHFEGGFHWA